LTHHVKVELPSHPQYLSVLRQLVEQLSVVAGFTDKECRGITLALDEACSNIIRHAYNGRDDKVIQLECHVHDDRVEFLLSDDGPPVDPAKLRYRSLDEVREGGLGTHLIALTMDDVQYERMENGNRLRLVKLRKPPE